MAPMKVCTILALPGTTGGEQPPVSTGWIQEARGRQGDEENSRGPTAPTLTRLSGKDTVLGVRRCLPPASTPFHPALPCHFVCPCLPLTLAFPPLLSKVPFLLPAFHPVLFFPFLSSFICPLLPSQCAPGLAPAHEGFDGLWNKASLLGNHCASMGLWFHHL